MLEVTSIIQKMNNSEQHSNLVIDLIYKVKNIAFKNSSSELMLGIHHF